MKAAEALIAWTPTHYADDGLQASATAGKVKIGPLLSGGPDWTEPYAYTGGAAYIFRRNLEDWQQIALVFIEFNTIVARDGINPKVAHEAFLAIDEYRHRISPDLPGAEDPDGGPPTDRTFGGLQ